MKFTELIEGVEYEAIRFINFKDDVREIVKLSNGKLLRKFQDYWINWDVLHNDLLDTWFNECEFEPEYNEKYYFPIFDRYLEDEDEDGYYDYHKWFGEELDLRIKKAVGVYRTKEQAIQKAKELGWV